ncbi:MAG: magnesium transporter [Magnetococcales bacterium]|nr:magnesium transporter [Magnetococcales bacterium]
MAMMVLDNTGPTAQPPINAKISEAIMRLHRRGSATHLTQLLSKLAPADIASVLNSFPEHKANEVFAFLSPASHASQVLEAMSEGQRNFILSHCPLEQIIPVLKVLPAELRQRRICGLGPEASQRLNEAMNEEPAAPSAEVESVYQSDTAGELMDTQIFAMPESTTAAEAINAVQGLSSHESIFYLYVVDDLQRLTGVCSLRKLILADPNKPIKEFTKTRLIKAEVNTPQGAVAKLLSRYRLLAVPVVDELGVLVGQITIDNVIHVIQEENTGSLMKMAGIGSKDANILAQSPFRIFTTRVPWLITAFVAYLLVSAILDGFEETLSAVVQLAFFFPIVIGMSGNAGSQTGAVVVRGLALGTIQSSHFFKLLFKELGANLVQGTIYGICLSAASYAIFQNPSLSLTLGPAMALSITIASAIAMSLPFFFKRIGVDPAVAAGPMALALIDMAGSINYLTIAFLVFSRSA